MLKVVLNKRRKFFKMFKFIFLSLALVTLQKSFATTLNLTEEEDKSPCVEALVKETKLSEEMISIYQLRKIFSYQCYKNIKLFERINSTDFKDCLKLMETARENSDAPFMDRGVTLCSSKGPGIDRFGVKKIFNPTYLQCFKKSLSLVSEDYFIQNALSVIKKETPAEFDRFEVLKNDCSKLAFPEDFKTSDGVVLQNNLQSNAKVLFQKYFHTHSLIKTTDNRFETFRGLSGLSYNRNTKTLNTVSDNRKNSTRYRFQLSTDYKFSEFDTFESNIVFTTYNKKNVPQYDVIETDWEDIQELPNHQFLMVTESVIAPKSTKYKTFFVILDPLQNNYSNLDTPNAFIPRTSFFDENAEGILNNKGIEGLTFNPKDNTVWFSNEGSLEEDSIGTKKAVRLSKQTLFNDFTGWQEEGYLPYPLNTRYSEAGVSALQILKDGRILVLERSFNQKKEEASVLIYLVDPTSMNLFHQNQAITADTPLVQKKLILDLENIRSEFPAGLTKIDNFEGITILDDSDYQSTGKLKVMLVTDNNEKTKQNTVFLGLELDVNHPYND